MTNSSGLTLDEFRAKFDPTFKSLDASMVFDRPLRKGARTFIVVAAQNATPVHDNWWQILLTIAKHRNAELLVIPLRYKNPTSKWTGSQRNAEHWAAEVQPYLYNQRLGLNSKLTVLGDFKIQPTASDPLTGAEALSLEQSGIIGHTKLHMRSIPTPSSRMAKVLTTTGACTLENYTDSRAGRIGEFHHSMSAVIVEIANGKRFHLRHVHFDAKGNSATDLGVRYLPNGYGQAPRPLALVMGDTHVDALCPLVKAATFGPGGMVQALKPQHLIWHDLLDGYSCNPHHKGNPFNAIAKTRRERASVEEEVFRAISFVQNNTPKDCKSIVVASNHNDFLHRWVKNTDWRTDPLNAAFYLETALAMTRGTDMDGTGTTYPDPFAYWFRQAKVPRARVLDQDESFTLGGVELGMHGDRGPNGSRGSIRNLRRLGVKSIIGHTHSPGIDEGCYQTGTSTHLRLEYNHGASSWLNAHCILHADGKRQLIVIVDGQWRGRL